MTTATQDIASASLLEVWIDETERRTWFLFESTRAHKKAFTGELPAKAFSNPEGGLIART